MATHSSTLAWKIPWTEEPGRLQSMGSQRVGHDWATSLSLSHIGEGNGNPPQCSCLENPRDRGPWWAAVCGVAQSQTRLKRLSSSSMIKQSHSQAYTWRKTWFKRIHGPQCSLHHYLQYPRQCKQPTRLVKKVTVVSASGSRWWSRRTCAHLLPWEHRNCN